MATKIDGVEEKVLSYRLVKRINPLKPEEPAGVGPLVVNRDPVTLDDICQVISQRSTLCDSDVYQVVQALLSNAAIRLGNSEAFNLGYLGYLALSIKTDLVRDPDEYKRSNIRKVTVGFHPSPKLRKDLQAIRFKRVK